MAATEKNDLDDFSNLKVLIIDDNRLVHEVLKKAFFDLGIRQISHAESAYYGISLCQQTHFHVVLCAFNVDSDKDGFHLLEELKFKGFVTKTTVLIFLSSETKESLVNSIIELQPDDFWVKPLAEKKVKTRLVHTLQTKKQLFNIYSAIDRRDFSKAIYHADQYIRNPELALYHANIMRMKGEALLSLLEFKDAESFYKELLETYRFAWVYLGYVKSLLKQGRIEDIHEMLDKLFVKADTRFGAHDLVAQYYIEQHQYDLAYTEMKKAMALSPRNIERNKKSWDLARLNHDHQGQYHATLNIAKQAKNSIHDSPELTLNVVRSGIDFANAMADDSAGQILSETERYLSKLENSSKDSKLFSQQLAVARARLHNTKKETKKAAGIVKNFIDLTPYEQIEDNLDKVKVFHELGMREEAVQLLAEIKNQISGDSLTSQVIKKYVEQEMLERAEINFTPKELSKMADEHLNKNRVQPALEAIEQALVLSPKNVKLTLGLLKTLILLKKSTDYDEKYDERAVQALAMLGTANMDKNNRDTFESLKVEWQEI